MRELKEVVKFFDETEFYGLEIITNKLGFKITKTKNKEIVRFRIKDREYNKKIFDKKYSKRKLYEYIIIIEEIEIHKINYITEEE